MFDCIDCVCNPMRRSSMLGYVRPLSSGTLKPAAAQLAKRGAVHNSRWSIIGSGRLARIRTMSRTGHYMHLSEL